MSRRCHRNEADRFPPASSYPLVAVFSIEMDGDPYSQASLPVTIPMQPISAL